MSSPKDRIKAMDPIERFTFEIMSLRMSVESNMRFIDQSMIVCNAMASATHDVIKNTLGKSCPEIYKTNADTTKAWYSIKEFVKGLANDPEGVEEEIFAAKGIIERMEKFEKNRWIDQELLFKAMEDD